MTQIIRLKQATGAQLQQAARHAKLIDVPNQVYGLANAYYAAVPSPMQEQILRKALQAAGINYLKVEECVTPASEADHFPRELQVGLRNLCKAAATACQTDKLDVEVRVAGHILYAAVTHAGMDDPVKRAKSLVKGQGFTQQWSKTWTKVVRFKRGKVFVALVEATGTGLVLSVFKGA
jgi:hypothetical protein